MLAPTLAPSVWPLTLQAAARHRLHVCPLSKPAQAGLEPQAPAPEGVAAPAVWQSQSRGPCLKRKRDA